MNGKETLINVNLFKLDLGNDKKKLNIFKKIHEEKLGDWKAISAELVEKGFEAEIVQKLEFTKDLDNLTSGNEKLIEYFQKDSQTKSLRDIALNFDKEKLKTAIIKSDPEIKAIEAERFTDEIEHRIFREVPTAKVINIISNDEEIIKDVNIRQGVTDVLKKQSESFKITENSVYKVLNNLDNIPEQNHEKVKNELKSIWRVSAISPNAEVIPVLLKNNLTSSLQISNIPQGQFVETYATSFGENGVEIAKQLHTNAVNTSIRNEQALINLQETATGTGIAFIDKSLNVWKHQLFFAEQLQKHDLSWDLLFGDTDFCECGECTSVYSATAYFVELLQYLRNNNLEPSKIKAKPSDISNTPLEKLFNRRPDLGCLELTCKNTNTILPYVDLVNEILESYVVHKKIKYFNIKEDDTSGELLAQPQNTQIEAYKVLHKSFYPFTLPYHQPVDAIRTYLEFLKTSRHNLIDVFRSSFDEKTEIIYDSQTPSTVNSFTANQIKELQDLHSDYLNRAIDSEYLGITQEEYIILTKEAFVTKKFWEKQTKKTYADKVYQKKIGVLPVHEYYGYVTENEMLSRDETKKDGLTFVKEQFLPRTGIAYKDLVELLETKYLNPSLPEEKKLTILKKIRFSYEFLQSLIEPAAGPDKYKKLIKFIKENQPPAQIDPCNPTNVESSLSETEIEEWVKTSFVEIGQTIVLGRILEKIEVPTFKCSEGKFKPAFEVSFPLPSTPIHSELNKIKIMDVSGNVIRDETPSFAIVGSYLNLDVTVNENYEIILNGEGQNKFPTGIDNNGHIIYSIDPIKITNEVIGSVNCSTGELIGKTYLGKQVSFLWNTWKYISIDGKKGNVQNGFLVMEETVVPDVSHQIIPETCDIAKIRLKHLDGSSITKEELDKIQRFIRLWRNLGWTIDEVESAIFSFQKEGEIADITADLLHQITIVNKLKEKTGLELNKLLTFWNPISTKGENSLYKRLFLTHNIIHLDPVFKPDGDGLYLTDNAKFEEHLPVIMAVFNLNSSEIEVLFKFKNLKIELTDTISLTNISLIYRHCALAGLLKLKLSAFLSWVNLLGDPFVNADTTLSFLNRYFELENAGFNHRQLNYLINNEDDTAKPIKFSEKTITQFINTLTEGFKAIEIVPNELENNSGNSETFNGLLENQHQVAAELRQNLIIEKLSDLLALEKNTTSILVTKIFKNKSDFEELKNTIGAELEKLQKTAIFINTLNLQIGEVEFFNNYKGDFSNTDVEDFDISNLQIKHINYFANYTEFRDSLPKSNNTLVEFFKWTIENNDLDSIIKELFKLTLWKEIDVKKLIDSKHFNLQSASDFRDTKNLLRLQKAVSMSEKIGFDINSLFEWAKPASDFEKTNKIANDIQASIKAQYKQTNWEQVIKPINDKLRNHQKNALINYLLQQPELIKWGIKDADGLFEYFLIDVEMQPCMETSRIKQAISSVQTFIQRCFLGLEEHHSGISPKILDRKRWEWMKRYRVWEANRKVFLYPENWIESNLRDDKSPFFKELESELLQKDITKQSVGDALKDYLYKVDEVANMQIINMYFEGERKDKEWLEGSKLHLFARTRNAPYFFYYRYLALDQMNWLPWEKVQVDIPSYDVTFIPEIPIPPTPTPPQPLQPIPPPPKKERDFPKWDPKIEGTIEP